MGIFGNMFGRKAAGLTYDQVADLIDKNGGAAYTDAGIFVTPKTALQVSTVLACARAIAEGCATPDLHVFREKKDKTREKAVNIPEYRILSRRPNEWQTSFEWRRMMTLHAVLNGMGLSIITRGDNNRVRELIPVDNWHERRVSRYEVVYDCYDRFGFMGTFPSDEVFILRNLQWTLMENMNCVQIASQSIKIALANDKNLAKQQDNGLNPAGVYSFAGSLNPEQHAKLEGWVMKKIGSGKPLLLDRDAKWQQLSQTNSDGQQAELRSQTIEEVCRVMGVFPIIVGHSDKAATFASTEAFFGAHLKNCLMPWHKNWTQVIDEKLLDGSGPLYAQFDTRYLTAGSMKDRGEWARSMVEMGIYTRNEIRDEDGLDPLSGLDEPLTPLNMSTDTGGNTNAKA